MAIYASLLIPLATVIILLAGFRRKMARYEYAIFLAPVLLVAIAKSCSEAIQTQDTEYWGGWVTQATYYEDWDEEVPCSHPHMVPRTDSDGNITLVQDGWEHAYDVDEHPEYWQAVDSNGSSWHVSRGHFEKLAKQFGNKTFRDLNRNYHSDDGDAWDTIWKGEDNSLEPTTTVHSYENRVQASRSVFKFPKVDPKQYGLYDYPKVTGYYDCQAVLAPGVSEAQVADRTLMRWNAQLGRKKQVRMFVLVFKNQPRQAGFDQESYWQGGNKNEFIVMVGVNSQLEVQWAHIASWTEVDDLKLDARQYVEGQKQLDLVGLVNWLGPQVEQRFVRKQFADFNYLTVDPPLWSVITTFLVTLAICIGFAVWAVTNQEDEDTTLSDIGLGG